MKKLLYLLLSLLVFVSCSEDGLEENIVITPPRNQIWYTTTYGDVLLPYDSNAFGAKILSNTYENGQGVITFGDEVKYIGRDAFSDCEGLKSIILPPSVKVIKPEAFYRCKGLESVEFPEFINEIGFYAFIGCNSLQSISIPNSVKEIGDEAFADCNNLKTIYCKSVVPPKAMYKIFGKIALYREIYVPIGSSAAYKEADGWKDYAVFILEADF